MANCASKATQQIAPSCDMQSASKACNYVVCIIRQYYYCSATFQCVNVLPRVPRKSASNLCSEKIWPGRAMHITILHFSSSFYFILFYYPLCLTFQHFTISCNFFKMNYVTNWQRNPNIFFLTQGTFLEYMEPLPTSNIVSSVSM